MAHLTSVKPRKWKRFGILSKESKEELEGMLDENPVRTLKTAY
jgi:hypothetical protein